MNDAIKPLFDPAGAFSAADLARILTAAASPAARADIVRDILAEAHRVFGKSGTAPAGSAPTVSTPAASASASSGYPAPGLEKLHLARVLHTLGSALERVGLIPPASPSRSRTASPAATRALVADAISALPAAVRSWLESLGLGLPAPSGPPSHSPSVLPSGRPSAAAHSPRSAAFSAAPWPRLARDAAFDTIGRTIVLTRTGRATAPRNALRADEIIWGRSPARLDLGGGWSDTPPYSLEHGGCVINAAVDLNGQPPIQVFARVIETPEIRINSIDHGSRLTVRTFDELQDYRTATSQFGLAKAALALSGFAPHTAPWPPAARRSLAAMLRHFGGGIELNTLAAIPSGSGLGTSSIMGAVLVAVIRRMIGDRPSERELFHAVLKLEQELTTGGGWQDQIGGVLPGVKVITSGPGLVPDPWIHYVMPDLLDPRLNGGMTLLYYTGIRRLAKNILRYVVGNYLDRDAEALATLKALHAYPAEMREAMAAKDPRAFGRLIDVAWRLNKRIDPDSTTPEIEAILARIRPHVQGAKLLGAGGGGFLLIVGKSPKDAAAVRRQLTAHPPNARARFFDYQISASGLTVTVC
jgi:galactokinase/mevalonate kinase-like predicted kinase